MLLLQHAHTGLWMFPGGYEEPRDASRHHTATREFVEEVQGVREDQSVEPGSRLLEAAVRRRVWLGPYGAAPYVPHMAFVLIDDGSILPEMDSLVRDFRRNSECAAIALAPIAVCGACIVYCNCARRSVRGRDMLGLSYGGMSGRCYQ
jgi:hypothetical protein